MFRRTQIFFAVILALQGAPLTALAQAQTAPGQVGDLDLSFADAQKLISGFQISQTEDQVTLYGLVAKACVDGKRFLISNSQQADDLKKLGKVGFRITVDQSVKDCLDKPENKCAANKEGCVGISRKSEASFSIADKADGKVHLLRQDPNKEIGAPGSLLADDTGIVFKSAKTLAAEAQAKERREREARVAALRAQANQCRRSAAELEIARQALGKLQDDGALKDGEWARISSALDKADFDVLKKEVTSSKIADISSLRERVAAYAATHAEQSDQEAAARLFYDLALKASESNDENGDYLELAKSLVSDALELDVTRLSKARLESLHQRFEVQAMGNLASQGWNTNMVLQKSFQSQAKDLYAQVLSSCYNMSEKRSGSVYFTTQRAQAKAPDAVQMERCQSASQLFQTVLKIRQDAQQADFGSQQQMVAQAPGQGALPMGGAQNMGGVAPFPTSMPGMMPNFGGMPMGGMPSFGTPGINGMPMGGMPGMMPSFGGMPGGFGGMPGGFGGMPGGFGGMPGGFGGMPMAAGGGIGGFGGFGGASGFGGAF